MKKSFFFEPGDLVVLKTRWMTVVPSGKTIERTDTRVPIGIVMAVDTREDLRYTALVGTTLGMFYEGELVPS